MTGVFRVKDVRVVFPPLPAETVVLGSYTFLAHHRTGIAAALAAPFSPGAPARGEVRLTIPVVAADGSRADAPVTLQVRGPGDVGTLIARQVVRRYPEPGAATAEPNDLVHIELDLPDLPWMFTPTAPDRDGHLPPWLRLVVAPAASVVLHPPVAAALPEVATVRLVDLPPPEDAWAWAHVQVQGPKATPGLAERLAPSNPTLNIARLLSPRRLTPDVDWIAMVVPTFEAGRLAGLDIDPPADATLAWAWGPGSPATVDLPVYDWWRFGTGDEGDFEALARRLLPVPPPAGVGRRRVDTSHPGNGIASLGADPGGDRAVFGPLVRVGDPTTDGKAWPAGTTEVLEAQLEAPARQRYSHPDAAPTVAPPLYAGAHLARGELGSPGEQPAWFRTLNLDPVDRVVAGLGARVVAMDQEDLMVSAWTQVAGVEAANAALRAAQLGRWVSASLHRRHLATLPPAALVAVTARGHARLRHGEDETVLAVVEHSVLPVAAAGPVLRRLARPAGPLARFTRGPDGAPDGAADVDGTARAAAARRLVASDGDVSDWVVAAPEPDGIRSVAAATLALLPDDLARQVADTAPALASAGLIGLLTEGGMQQGGWSYRLDGLTPEGTRQSVQLLLAELMEHLPAPEQVRQDRDEAAVASSLVAQVRAIDQAGRLLQVDRWQLSSQVCERFDVGGIPSDDDPDGPLNVDLDVPLALADRVAQACLDNNVADPGVDQRVMAQLLQMREAPSGGLAQDLVRLSADLAVTGVADRPRTSLAVATLDLVARLDPAVTVVRRVRARIATWPTWLLPDWFDDTRIDPVMVAPVFHHPMYEALDRYDHEWLLPGVAAMSPLEMTTLLQTNARFVEAFLIGANHEMARELLWREYPTDGRATSFRSFWTPGDELTGKVHELLTGDLGTHVDPDLSGAIVLLVRGELVRRYPDVLAHAVQQTGLLPLPPVFRDDPDPAFAAIPADTLFRLHLAPDVLLVGFRLRAAAVAVTPSSASPSWWFTLSEHVGQPRFGLDVLDLTHPDEGHAPHSTVHRNDLAWGDLTMSGPFLTPATNVLVDQATNHDDAAGVAEWLFQLPARAAFLGTDMIAKMS